MSRPRPERAAARPPGLRRLLDVLPVLVDPAVGIVSRVLELPRQAGTPDFFHVYARCSNTGAFAGRENFADTGGAAADRLVALAKAVGEAVERYCAAIYELEELPLASAREASFRCVSPAELALYDASQLAEPDFDLVGFDDDTTVRWTPAVDARSGDVWHVPAALVYVPYFFYRETGDRPIAQPISTGLACHCSREEAALAALCEVVERDAFTLAWQACGAAPRLRRDGLGATGDELARRFERAGYRIDVLDLTTDLGIPTLLATARGEAPSAPALVVAASCDPDPATALRRCLEELAHTLRLCARIKAESPPEATPMTAGEVVDQRGHLRFWTDHRQLERAAFLWSGEEDRTLADLESLATSDPASDLERVVERVAAAGHRTLLAELTTEDVATLGLHVVRAVVPGLQPLCAGHAYRALGGERLRRALAQSALPQAGPPPADNPAPHPYP